VLDVFRFAWFAFRTLLGVILLVLAMEAAMWVLVKLHSMAAGSASPSAASRRVMSYSAPGVRHTDRRGAAVSSASPPTWHPPTESGP